MKCLAEIVRIQNSKKKKLSVATDADLNQADDGSEKNSDSEKMALIALLSELPSKKDKGVEEPTKSFAEVELEGLLDTTQNP